MLVYWSPLLPHVEKRRNGQHASESAASKQGQNGPHGTASRRLGAPLLVLGMGCRARVLPGWFHDSFRSIWDATLTGAHVAGGVLCGAVFSACRGKAAAKPGVPMARCDVRFESCCAIQQNVKEGTCSTVSLGKQVSELTCTPDTQSDASKRA